MRRSHGGGHSSGRSPFSGGQRRIGVGAGVVHRGGDDRRRRQGPRREGSGPPPGPMLAELLLAGGILGEEFGDLAGVGRNSWKACWFRGGHPRRATRSIRVGPHLTDQVLSPTQQRAGRTTWRRRTATSWRNSITTSMARSVLYHRLKQRNCRIRTKARYGTERARCHSCGQIRPRETPCKRERTRFSAPSRPTRAGGNPGISPCRFV